MPRYNHRLAMTRVELPYSLGEHSRHRTPDMAIEPFSIPFSQPSVDDLRDRLRRTRWPDEIPGANWEYGVDLRFLRQICEYWRDQFDWKAQVANFSAFHHYRYLSDGIGIKKSPASVRKKRFRAGALRHRPFSQRTAFPSSCVD
jgi:Epoxide hydrolase N terminus